MKTQFILKAFVVSLFVVLISLPIFKYLVGLDQSTTWKASVLIGLTPLTLFIFKGFCCFKMKERQSYSGMDNLGKFYLFAEFDKLFWTTTRAFLLFMILLGISYVVLFGVDQIILHFTNLEIVGLRNYFGWIAISFPLVLDFQFHRDHNGRHEDSRTYVAIFTDPELFKYKQLWYWKTKLRIK